MSDAETGYVQIEKELFGRTILVREVPPVYLLLESESAHRSQTIRNYYQEGFSSSSKMLAEDATADVAI